MLGSSGLLIPFKFVKIHEISGMTSERTVTMIVTVVPSTTITRPSLSSGSEVIIVITSGETEVEKWREKEAKARLFI